MGRGKSQITPKTLFGKRLKYALGDRKYFEFEQINGLSNGQISKILNGAEPRLSAIEAIIKGTGCSPSWLMFGEGEPFINGRKEESVFTESKEAIIKGGILPDPNGVVQRGALDLLRKPQSFHVVGEAAADETRGSRAGIFPEDAGAIWDDVEIPETTHFVKILGDSMAPLLLDGQYAMVGVEYVPPYKPVDREIVVAEVAINDEEQAGTDRPFEGVYCKRVVDAVDMWLFESINYTGAPFSIAKANCRLWPVIGVYFAGKGRPPEED